MVRQMKKGNTKLVNVLSGTLTRDSVKDQVRCGANLEFVKKTKSSNG